MPFDLTPEVVPGAEPAATEGGAAAADAPKEGVSAQASSEDATAPGTAPAKSADASAAPGEKKPEPKPEADAVIELSRSNREHKSKAATLETENADLKGRLKDFEPITQLFALAKDDPIRALEEFADGIGLEPSQATALLAKRKAGEAPSADDRMAMLERELRELKAGQAKKDEARTAAEQRAADDHAIKVHKASLDSVLAKDAAKYPHVAKLGEEGRDEAFGVMVAHWEKTKQVMPYDQAVAAVEKYLVTRKELLNSVGTQGAAGATGNGAPTRDVGVSNGSMGALPPASRDPIRSDEEILADARRFTGAN